MYCIAAMLNVHLNSILTHMLQKQDQFRFDTGCYRSNPRKRSLSAACLNLVVLHLGEGPPWHWAPSELNVGGSATPADA